MKRKPDGQGAGKVVINGKESAVVGSTVTTCNDIGMRDNSTILAGGMSIPMPMIVHPKNSGEYERAGESVKKKTPRFNQVRWGATRAGEGEEVTLSAGVADIADGNMVTLQVFRAGRGPEDSTAQAVFSEKVKGGIVSAKWSYRANRRELPPEENPKFIFTAHSAWCNWEQSSNTLEVVVERPEIRKAEWQDSEGKRISKGCVGRAVKLHAEAKDIGEGEGVTFTVYDKYKRGVYSVGAHVAKGIAEAEWTYQYAGEKLTEKPKFTFAVTGQRCKILESPEIEMGATFDCFLQAKEGDLLENYDYKIIQADNSIEEGKTEADGIIKVKDAIPGVIAVEVNKDNRKFSYLLSCGVENSREDEIKLIPHKHTKEVRKAIDYNKKIILQYPAREIGLSE